MRYLVCKESIVNGEVKFKNPYVDSMRRWHENFEDAKKEANRLCLLEDKIFYIFGEVAKISPNSKTILEDYRKDIK